MSKFYWNTTLPILQEVLNRIKAEAAFAPFRLVGGTSLSLQLGHRMSDDIDLFTDHPYGSIDFDGIDKYLRGSFSYVTPQSPGPIGMGHSYMVGNSGGQAVKLDLYYTDAFVQQPIVINGLKMATVEEIAPGLAKLRSALNSRGRLFPREQWRLHLSDPFTGLCGILR